MSRFKNALWFAAWFCLSYLFWPVLKRWVEYPDCPYNDGCLEEKLPRFVFAAAAALIGAVISLLLSWYAKRPEKPAASATDRHSNPSEK